MDIVMVKSVTMLYLTLSALRVFSYLPQIVSVSKDKSAVKAISLFTWTFWMYSHIATFLYTTIVTYDLLLALMSFGNALCCATVMMLVMYKRRKYAGKQVPGLNFIFDYFDKRSYQKASDHDNLF